MARKAERVVADNQNSDSQIPNIDCFAYHVENGITCIHDKVVKKESESMN